MRRYPVGAELTVEGASLRVWAPACQRVEVVAGNAGRATPLSREGNGYFSGLAARLDAGDRYGFRLDGGEAILPDPASRAQPDGPHGLSAIVDPSRFSWTDAGWRGVTGKGQVIYELHVGTFTAEGTFAAAARELPSLRELGVTVVELMPVAEFPGRFGWGYDGVDLWAPRARLRHARRSATARRSRPRPRPRRHPRCRLQPLRPRRELPEVVLAALLHRSPHHRVGRRAGLRWPAFAARSASSSSRTPATGSTSSTSTACGSTPPRRSSTHRPSTCSRRSASACAAAARGRDTLVVAEHESQDARLVRSSEAGGYGLDGVWNDDFHHAARVALTGRNEAYYRDYLGRPQELISALRWGYLYQGQWYRWQRKRRGTPALDLPAERFVVCLENHDQVANTLPGARLPTLTSPGRLRAMTALTLLAPGTPMLFQGQEFGSTRPFLYFADHDAELAKAVRDGTRRVPRPVSVAGDAGGQGGDPGSGVTGHVRALQAGSQRARAHPAAFALHRDLLALRRSEAAFAQQRADRMHGAVLGDRRWRCVSSATTRPATTTACCSSTSGPTSISPRSPSRCWHRPAGGVEGALVQRGARLRRHRNREAGHRRRVGALRRVRAGPLPRRGDAMTAAPASAAEVRSPSPPASPGARATTPPSCVREWMVTNGLGGYAAGTLAGCRPDARTASSSRRCRRRSGAPRC